MKSLSKIGVGSSKDLFGTLKKPQHIYFQFSDRVSVFDYGALPDEIIDKGKNLFQFALKIEELFEKNKIKTLFDSKETENSGLFAMQRASHPKFPNELDAQLEWEFIPLEVIFRWGVPKGSSLLKRDLNLKPWQKFKEPLIEFTTKLEPTDRLLNKTEAIELLKNRIELDAVLKYSIEAASVLKKYFDHLNVDLWDGKFELAFNKKTKELALVDAITPDELRLTLPGLMPVPLSKELLRQWLLKTNWGFELAQKKRLLGSEWKQNLPSPPRLGHWRMDRLTKLYEALAMTVENGESLPLLNWARDRESQPEICVVGGGGREAALSWRLDVEGAHLRQVNSSSELFNGDHLSKDFSTIDAFFVSQDADLEAGLIDRLEKLGCWAYGPVRKAAELEWSKTFGRDIAHLAGVKCPQVTHDIELAKKFRTAQNDWPVVKFDGLAAGKGVVVPKTEKEFESAVLSLKAKGRVLFEEQLSGIEASAFFAVESGHSGIKTHFLGTAQDFKRRFAGDEGPNTGGMGALAPHPKVTDEEVALFQTWAEKTALALHEKGIPYNGILYLGLMKDKIKGWTLIEYNSRPGDPETEALVLNWPENQECLRFLLGLSIRCEIEFKAELKSVCLSLVRPEYPGKPKQDLELPNWNFSPEYSSEKRIQLFRSQSQTGRVAFLVAAGESYLEAGDLIFERLTDSPWKEKLEWRADILS